jgi:hypothetical protein
MRAKAIVSSKGQVTLPTAMRAQLGIQTGSDGGQRSTVIAGTVPGRAKDSARSDESLHSEFGVGMQWGLTGGMFMASAQNPLQVAR